MGQDVSGILPEVVVVILVTVRPVVLHLRQTYMFMMLKIIESLKFCSLNENRELFPHYLISNGCGG